MYPQTPCQIPSHKPTEPERGREREKVSDEKQVIQDQREACHREAQTEELRIGQQYQHKDKEER
jgi:hypothetical protein